MTILRVKFYVWGEKKNRSRIDLTLIEDGVDPCYDGLDERNNGHFERKTGWIILDKNKINSCDFHLEKKEMNMHRIVYYRFFSTAFSKVLNGLF